MISQESFGDKKKKKKIKKKNAPERAVVQLLKKKVSQILSQLTTTAVRDRRNHCIRLIWFKLCLMLHFIVFSDPQCKL